MNANSLKQVIIDQKEIFNNRENIIERDISCTFVSSKKISVVTGIRRCGKSTLMKLISRNYKNYCYLNFEDERLIDFSFADFNNMLELFYEMYGNKPDAFFFDEIQNIYGWEKFARRMFNEGKKIFITGSNAKLLSSEFSTSLTGRYIKKELLPFSFTEFLRFKSIDIEKNLTTSKKAELKKHFNEYMKTGGFPEYVESKNKIEISQLYQDILIKDLIVRFGIRDTKSFRELSLYLLSNISSLYSYNNLSKLLNIKSTNSVKNYINFFEEAYLFFSLPKYEYSLKKQIIQNKKIYSIDTGIFNAVSYSFSENRGKQLENVVFLELKRRDNELYYYKNKSECDFIITEGNKPVIAIQVTEEFNKENKEREINGLKEAMVNLKIKQGLVLTYDQYEEIETENGKIRIIPIWYWILFVEGLDI